MGIAATQIVVFLSFLLLLLAWEFLTKKINSPFVIFHAIVAISNVKANIVVFLYCAGSFLETIGQLCLLLDKQLEGRFVLSSLVKPQAEMVVVIGLGFGLHSF